MKTGFTLTAKAMSDVKDIGRHTHRLWGRDQRNLYLSMLDACFHRLAANPLIGKDCSDIRDGYRKQTAGSHVIFYRQLSEERIEIVRILHGRMDSETRLSER